MAEKENGGPRAPVREWDKIAIFAFLACLAIGGIWKAAVTPWQSSPHYVEEVLLPELKGLSFDEAIPLISETAARLTRDNDVMPVVRALAASLDEQYRDKKYQDNLLFILRHSKADIAPAMPALIDLASGNAPMNTRTGVIYLLAAKGEKDPSVVIPALLRLATDEKLPGKLTEDAVNALAKFGPAAAPAFPALRERMLTTDDIALARNLGMALKAIGLPEGARQQFLEIMKETDSSARRMGLATVLKEPARKPNAEEADILAAALAREPNEDVRNALFAALDGVRLPAPLTVAGLADELKESRDWARLEATTKTIMQARILSDPAILDAYRTALPIALGRYTQGFQPFDPKRKKIDDTIARLMGTGDAGIQKSILEIYLNCPGIEKAIGRCSDILDGIQRGVPLHPEMVALALQRYRDGGAQREYLESILVFAGTNSLALIEQAEREESIPSVKIRLAAIRKQIPEREQAALAAEIRRRASDNENPVK